MTAEQRELAENECERAAAWGEVWDECHRLFPGFAWLHETGVGAVKALLNELAEGGRERQSASNRPTTGGKDMEQGQNGFDRAVTDLALDAQIKLANAARYPSIALRDVREARAILNRIDALFTSEDPEYAARFDADGNFAAPTLPLETCDIVEADKRLQAAKEQEGKR